MKTNVHSIQFCVWLTFLAFALAIVLVLWLFQVVFINTYYANMKENNIISASEEVKSVLESEALSEPQRTTALRNIANQYNTTITLIDKSTGEIFSYAYVPRIEGADKPSVGFFSPFVKDSIITGLEAEINANGSSEVLKYYEGSDMLVYGCLINAGDNAYIGVIASKLQRLDEIVDVISRQLVIVSIGLIAAAFIASILIATRVSRPLRQITQKAQLLSEGDYDVHFSEETKGSYVEVAKLAHTLNYATEGLKQVEKLRAEFIANVSHDLRTPLTMIKAYAEMIRDISGDNREKRDAHLRVIIQESDRLSELVSDLLDVSQLQAGALAYDPSVFDLTVLTKKVIGRLDLLCEKTGRKITVNTQEAVFVVGDIKKIQQVVYNLVTNALNYSGDSSMVDVLIEDIGDDKICFSVKDYGEGIAEEDLPNIWDRYYRVDKEHKRQIAGTGIGLSIVKSVLELHGTEYGVESTLGEGSRFWFILKKGREADTNE